MDLKKKFCCKFYCYLIVLIIMDQRTDEMMVGYKDNAMLLNCNSMSRDKELL